MQNRPTRARRNGPKPEPFTERRLPPGASTRNSLRWLRGLVLRPFRLGWRQGPRLVWVERRSAGDPALARLRADLSAAALCVDNAARLLQELLHVDERLSLAGWAGLADLPVKTLARARLQAEMLATECDSAALAGLASRLQALTRVEAGAAVSVSDTQEATSGPSSVVEVSELGEDAFAQAEQLWASSLPAPLPASAATEPGLKA